jgi:hypothetical protein
MLEPFWVFVLLLSGCANLFGATTSSAPNIATLAAKFRDLRAMRGCFDGADWNDDVDK